MTIYFSPFLNVRNLHGLADLHEEKIELTFLTDAILGPPWSYCITYIFNMRWNDLVAVVPGCYLQRPSWCCDTHLCKMTTSKRLVDHKSAKFQENVLKRGQVPETTVKKGNNYPVGPIVLGFFIFVVVGSAILQIFRTATSGGFF
jgi:hypothetical protein